jgi:hypothetical protein
MVIFSIFIAVLIIAVVWFIINIIYNERRKRKPTLPYKTSRFGVTSETMRSITGGFIASLILLFIGGFLWIVYGDTIMNAIDNLRQGKLGDSLSNNTLIGTKNPLDQIIIENLKNIIINNYIDIERKRDIIIFNFLRVAHTEMNTVIILGVLMLMHHLRNMLIRAILQQSMHIHLV